MTNRLLSLAIVTLLAACGPLGGGDSTDGVPVLGGNTHDAGKVQITEIGTSADGLRTPRAAAFNPAVPGELWVINYADDSMVIFTDVGTPEQSVLKRRGAGSYHFLAEPSSLAFGQTGTLATVHETDQPTGTDTPPDFMGPTLWSADLSVFDAGHAGHLDMLHNSPLGMGIAYGGTGNLYWVFDGYHGSITRYDFKGDHGPGGTNHSGAEVARFVEGEVLRLPGVPSHMAFDVGSGFLYIADSGHNRVAVLDTNTGAQGAAFGPNYDGSTQYRVNDATLYTLVDGTASGMQAPSGLILSGGLLYVTDNATSKVYAFTLDGKVVDWLETGLPLGSLTGLTADTNGHLVLTVATDSRVLQIAPGP